MPTWPAYGGNFTRDMAHAVGVIVEEWNELERSLEALLLTYLDSNLILGHIVTNEMGMRAFCADLTLCPRGHSYVENDEWIRVFCFAEKAHAEKFQAQFGGQWFDPGRRRWGPGWTKLKSPTRKFYDVRALVHQESSINDRAGASLSRRAYRARMEAAMLEVFVLGLIGTFCAVIVLGMLLFGPEILEHLSDA